VSRRHALVVLGLVVVTLLAHEALVRAMAHGHVAHVLLGSGNTSPPLGAAAMAVSLIVVRLLAIVVAPGAVLAALVSLLAHRLAGPPAVDLGVP
jgi:hypothetical protein